jgi:hypothetical protein
MSTRYEYYITGQDAHLAAYGVQLRDMSFTPTTGHTITSVKLLLYREGSPGVFSIDIKATDGNSKPTGASLCSGTYNGNTLTTNGAGAWVEITLGVGAVLTAGVKYIITITVPSGSAGNSVDGLIDSSSPSYAGGAYTYSTDNGASWTVSEATDVLFEEWGNPLATIGKTAHMADKVIAARII